MPRWTAISSLGWPPATFGNLDLRRTLHAAKGAQPLGGVLSRTRQAMMLGATSISGVQRQHRRGLASTSRQVVPGAGYSTVW